MAVNDAYTTAQNTTLTVPAPGVLANDSDPDGDDLRGARPIPSELQADWSYFFDVPGVEKPDGLNLSRLMDTQLAIPLHDLPGTVVDKTAVPVFADLAERNLLKQAIDPLASEIAIARSIPREDAQLLLQNTAEGALEAAAA